MVLSSQPYEVQSIQPYLREQLSEDSLKELLPDWSLHYRTSTIEAKAEPFRFIEFLFRKGAHLFIYAMVAALAYVALKPYRLSLVPKAVIALAGVGLVAVLDEWNQLRQPNRTGAMEDVILDLTGGAIGLLFVILFSYWSAAGQRPRRNSRRKNRPYPR